MWQRITTIIQAAAFASVFLCVHLPSVLFKQLNSHLMRFFCSKTSHRSSDVGRETHWSSNEASTAVFKGNCSFLLGKENDTVNTGF